jgi:hypothetical protein
MKGLRNTFHAVMARKPIEFSSSGSRRDFGYGFDLVRFALVDATPPMQRQIWRVPHRGTG